MYIDGHEFKKSFRRTNAAFETKKNTKVGRLERNHCDENKARAGFSTEAIQNVQKITMIETHAKTIDS